MLGSKRLDHALMTAAAMVDVKQEGWLQAAPSGPTVALLILERTSVVLVLGRLHTGLACNK